MVSQKTLDKLVRLLSQFKSAREIDAEYHIDRGVIRRHFSPPIKKPSVNYIVKTVTDIAKKKMTYKKVVETYGNRGLKSLSNSWDAKQALYYKNLVKNLIRDRDTSKDTISMYELGKKYNVSYGTVQLLLRKYGKRRFPKASEVIGKNVANKVIELHNKGYNSYQIASAVKKARGYVCAILREKYDVHLKPEGLKATDYFKIKELKKHLSWQQIGYVFRKSSKAVQNFYYYVAPLMEKQSKEESK